MYLKRLEIQGFKSFADKTVLHFGDDITAIVGPNGSGKSNISDAISWVMGEMSSKALRGAKMEDVIFGGTQKRSQVGFAEATLVLDNSDGALPLETQEVMITRRYYRSGESEYYINKQTARLRDINEMFMDTGLGREGYSNIGQGRIDEILSVKSTDRREVFEEAAGISKFRHRKEETQRRLATTEDNLMRIGDKISELELQVEPLRVQAEKARKFLTLREELKGLEVAVWLEKLQTLSATAQKAEADYASAAFILEQQHAELTRLYQLTDNLTMQLNRQSLELDSRREAIALREAELHQKESEMAVLQAGKENALQNISRIEQELADQQDRSGGVGQQIRQQQQRIEQIAIQLEQMRTVLAQAQEEADKLTASTDSTERQILGIRAHQSLLQADQARKHAQLTSLQSSSKELQQRAEALQQDHDAAAARRDDLARQAKEFEKALEEAQETVVSCRNSAAGYALRQKSRLEKRESLQKEVDALRIELQTARSRANMLRELQRDYEGFPRAIRLVMQEAGRSLRNIHGPVSSLIRTDDAYTLAVETALGGAMQNIVVDTEQDGKAAIQYLKHNDGGRATFLPLNVIKSKGLQERDMDTCPGFVGIASELVHCDSIYHRVVENLLGRIVLVEDMEHAIKMARKYQNRFKIVTLDGQVINAGGSMTGGSASKSAGILSRANELTRLDEKQKKLQEKLTAREAALTEADRSAAQVEFELSAIQGQLRQAEDDALRAKGDAGQAAALVQALEENIASYCRELALLNTRAAEENGVLRTLTVELRQNEEEFAHLDEQLQALTQGQNQLSREAGTLADRVTALRMDEAALEAERSTATDNVRRLQALAEAMEGDRGQKQQLIGDCRREIIDLEEKMAVCSWEKAGLEEKLQQAKDELQQASNTRNETEAKRVRTDKEIQAKNQEIQNMERETIRLENKKATTALEEQQIVDKLWDSYELTPSTASDSAAQIESITAANKSIADLKRRISALGTPNLGAIEEFDRVNERYMYLTAQRDDVLHAKRELENIIGTITAEMTEIFTREFSKINEHFGQTFVEMFGGGRGELILEDPREPLSCGIEIKVQPPGKQVKTITLLSGGEKAFVAIALYFAILKVRPTPFCLLDEIDAALDDRNVERFASYLRNLCEKTQFIVITHRRGTMEASDVLYGVTMQEQGISKILHLDLNQMQQELGIAN